MPLVLMSGWIAANTLDQDGLLEPAHNRTEPATRITARAPLASG
jgi:hypothetical protein